MQLLSTQAQEKILMESMRDARNNKPKLTDYNTKSIHAFIEGWYEYKNLMDQFGVQAHLSDCIQKDVHAHFAKVHRVPI